MRMPLIAAFILALAANGSTLAAEPASEPIPAPVRAFLEQQGFTTLKLTKLRTGHEAIEGSINGIAGIFVLDSGANLTVLHKDRLAKFAIAEAAAADGTGAGAGGAVAIGKHIVAGVTLDGKPVPLGTVYSTDLTSVVSSLKAAAGVEIDGVVGQDVLSGYSGIINIGTSELYLKLPHPAV